MKWLVGVLLTSSILAGVCCGLSDPCEDEFLPARCCNETLPNENNTFGRLAALRSEMEAEGAAAYIIPMDDEHQSEYVSERDKRVAYVSDFGGSAGTLAVTKGKAVLLTDGRYFTEAERRDCNWGLLGPTGTPSLTEWLGRELSPADKVTATTKFMSYERWNSYNDGLEKEALTFSAIDDLVGKIWDEDQSNPRPTEGNADLEIHNVTYSGLTWEEKRSKFQQEGRATVVTALDEVAWLHNLRSSDIPYNPLFFAYAVILPTSSRLYLRNATGRLADQSLRDHLGTDERGSCTSASSGTCVEVRNYSMFFDDLAGLANGQNVSHVSISPLSSFAVFNAFANVTEHEPNFRLSVEPSAVRNFKARKNSVEIEAMRECHKRDSVILIEFFANLQNEIQAGIAWDEMKVVSELTHLRTKSESKPLNRGESFGTIAGYGANGAIIHYKPNPKENKSISTDNTLLIDTGGQYLDGTTDVTRTFHFGEPEQRHKEAYTLVLMGSIDVASMVFPDGTYGRYIDPIARRALWEHGLEYRHGTGHGIGAFLNVHEGPQSISPGCESYKGPIHSGMFTSDEPGFYQVDDFGIRLESAVMSKNATTKHNFDNMQFLGFETITLVPFERNLIEPEMMSEKQLNWLNSFHWKIREELHGELSTDAAREWLTVRTEPIGRNGFVSAGTAGTHSLLLLWSCFSVARLISWLNETDLLKPTC